MKKVMLFSLIIGVLTQVSNAQDIQFKPLKGNNSLELMFNPGAMFSNYYNEYGSPVGNGSLGLPAENGIKYRRWIKDNLAIRATIVGAYSNTLGNFTDHYYDDQGNRVSVNLERHTTIWQVGFNPGVEWHMKGTKRLSPYFGAEMLMSYGANEGRYQYLDNSNSGAILNTSFENENYYNGFPGTTFGLGGIGGFDVYLAKSLFLGVEMGYSFLYYEQNTFKSESTNQEPMERKGGSGFGFSPTFTNNFRLGWVF